MRSFSKSPLSVPAGRGRHGGTIAAAMLCVITGASVPAFAEIYTWTDAAGNVNLSNRPPPEGTRVTRVYREDPHTQARAESARAAARADEVRALSERVTTLERDLDAANRRPDPAPPVVYALPAPATYPSIVAPTIVVPNTPAYADCNASWSGCASAASFGLYPNVVVIDAGSPSRHGRRRPQAPARPATPPLPVGEIPEPPNLFPNVPRR